MVAALLALPALLGPVDKTAVGVLDKVTQGYLGDLVFWVYSQLV